MDIKKDFSSIAIDFELILFKIIDSPRSEKLMRQVNPKGISIPNRPTIFINLFVIPPKGSLRNQNCPTAFLNKNLISAPPVPHPRRASCAHDARRGDHYGCNGITHLWWWGGGGGRCRGNPHDGVIRNSRWPCCKDPLLFMNNYDGGSGARGRTSAQWCDQWWDDVVHGSVPARHGNTHLWWWEGGRDAAGIIRGEEQF